LTTNLSYSADILQRFLDRAKGSQWQWTIAVSAENLGARGEYVRHGLDWAQWTQNMNTVIHSHLFVNIQLLTTMSAVSIDGLVEFIDWTTTLKKSARPGLFNLYMSYVRWPTFQSVLILPMSLRQMYSEEITSCVERNSSWLNIKEQDLLNSFARYLCSVEQPHRGAYITMERLTFDDQQKEFNSTELEKDFFKFFTQYDQRRGLDFVTTFPRLKEWYESIQI
jgi:hypothetical protein